MYGTDQYTLNFKEKGGVLEAQVSLEAWETILNTTCCLPWIVDGCWGLLYCSRKDYEAALQELQNIVKTVPLSRHLIGGVAHRIELDKEGVLSIPCAAARFAGIRDKAVLIPLSKDRVLLQAEEQTEGKPEEGKLIRAEFGK